MKKLIIAGIVAVLGAGPACAQDSGTDTHESLVADTIKSIKDFSDILAQIKGKKSADDSKPKLEAMSKRMAELKKRYDKVGEPAGAKKEELEKKFKPDMEAAAKKLTGELVRIALNVEGGQDFVKDISSMFDSLKPKGKEKEKK